MKISLFTKKAVYENNFIGDLPAPEPEPKKCNCFGSGQNGRLRAASAPAPQHWSSQPFVWSIVKSVDCYYNFNFQQLKINIGYN